MMLETTRDPSTPLERFCAEHALPPSARVLLEAYMAPPLDLDAIEARLGGAAVRRAVERTFLRELGVSARAVAAALLTPQRDD